MQKPTFNSNSLPSNLAQIGITTKYTLLDYVRSRRFFILLSITLLIGGALTGIVGYYRPDSLLGSSLDFYGVWWTEVISFVIVLSGIFFGADAIASESQNKTGYFSIPNPIKRSSIYIGKWIAAFIAASAVFMVFTAITLGNGLFYFGLNVPFEFVQSLLFSWLYLAAVISFSFLLSSLFKSSAMAILVSAILFLFAFNLIQLLIQAFIQIEPWFIITYGAEIITNIFIVPFPVHALTVSDAGQSFTMFTSTVPEGIAIMALYIVVTTVIGLVLFKKREFT
jgi:ABC-2 type transport system permease protein